MDARSGSRTSAARHSCSRRRKHACRQDKDVTWAWSPGGQSFVHGRLGQCAGAVSMNE